MNLNAAMILVKKVFDKTTPNNPTPITELAQLIMNWYSTGYAMGVMDTIRKIDGEVEDEPECSNDIGE
jgi:hypothetical protein